MNAYGIFGCVVIGAMGGAIGSRIPNGEDGGLASVVTGVIGAVIGGFVATAAFGRPSGTIGLLATLAGALLGACLFIAISTKVSHLARPADDSQRSQVRGRVTRSST